MAWIKAIAAEVFALFVDDGVFAIAILVWVALVWLLLPAIGVPADARGPILFAGLAAILVDSVARRARK